VLTKSFHADQSNVKEDRNRTSLCAFSRNTLYGMGLFGAKLFWR